MVILKEILDILKIYFRLFCGYLTCPDFGIQIASELIFYFFEYACQFSPEMNALRVHKVHYLELILVVLHDMGDCTLADGLFI